MTGKIHELNTVGKTTTREYKGYTITIEHRTRTNDFRWSFVETKTIQLKGNNNTADKCFKDACEYIDILKPDK